MTTGISRPGASSNSGEGIGAMAGKAASKAKGAGKATANTIGGLYLPWKYWSSVWAVAPAAGILFGLGVVSFLAMNMSALAGFAGKEVKLDDTTDYLSPVHLSGAAGFKAGRSLLGADKNIKEQIAEGRNRRKIGDKTAEQELANRIKK